MENIVKITQLEEQMKEVNKKMASFDKKMDQLCEKIDKGFAQINLDMTATYVRKTEYEIEKRQILDELDKTKSIWNWAIRLILGAIILALLGTILI